SGGDRLETAQRELRAVERRLAEVRRERDRFDEVLAGLSVEVSTAEQFVAVQAQARAAQTEGDARRAARAAFAEAESARQALVRRRAELADERDSAGRLRGSIPA